MGVLTGAAWPLTFILLPVGWVRWNPRAERKTFSSASSLAGFTLATVSAFLVIAGIVAAPAIAVFSRQQHAVVAHIYLSGFLLSFSGLTASAVGLFRRNTLRWFAPCLSISTFLIWLGLVASE